MTTALTVARGQLAALLLLAAAAKILDRNAWRSLVAVVAELDTGRVQPPAALARLAVGAELSVAILLVSPGVPPQCALIPFLMLMMTFTAAQLMLVSKGSTTSCACFGGLTSEGVGVRSVARNLALLALGLGLLALPSQAGHGFTEASNLSYAGMLLTSGIALILTLRRRQELIHPSS